MFSVKDKNVYDIASKLHRQFGHPNSDKLIKLIKNAGDYDKTLIEAVKTISSECETCSKFKKPVPRPIVSLPMGTRFNQTVSMDLKFYKGNIFLVLVDVATRYCSACVISNKKPEMVVRAIFTKWISIFGAPTHILHDNGGEFVNETMRDMCEKFNIKVLTTSAESPWSNGVCERLNAILGASVDKIIYETNCDPHTALAWAVSARNALSNNSGFSPNQLVFGFNPAFPSFDKNEAPAFERPASQIVETNLCALRKAREEFIKVDSNDRLNRAMRHNIRESEVPDLCIGESVYYYRRDSKEWRGPAVVIGRDGSQVIVKHAGAIVRVHALRLRRSTVNIKDFEKPLNNSDDRVTTVTRSRNLVEEDSEEEVSETEEATVNSPCIDSPQISDDSLSPENSGSSTDRCSALGEENRGTAPATIGPIKFHVGQRISAKEVSSGEKLMGTIISRAGKATSKYKNCWNIKKNDNTIVNFDVIKDLVDVQQLDEDAEMLVLYTDHDVETAKNTEIDNWQKNNVFEAVENMGQDTLSVRWVITEKLKGGKRVVKARLVARGFEEDTRNLRKDSPTCSREAIRLTLAIAKSKGWAFHSLDVKAAYLQGNEIEREIFVKPPPEFYEGKIWRLKKTVYGLNDAARAWYLRVKEELINLGAQVCMYDSALFTWKVNGMVEGIITVYVDDFLWAGTKKFENCIISNLKELFLIGGFETGSFKYIGLQMNDDGLKGASIHQLDYVDTLQKIPVSPGRSGHKSSLLTDAEKTDYRSIVGQLNWVATQTRPDILFDVCDLSSRYKTAVVADLVRVNKVLTYLKHDQVKVKIPKLENIDGCSLHCYTDASFANHPDGSSQVGLIIFLASSDGNRCPIYWQSKKARHVVKSTLAAETMALLDGAEASIYVSYIISDIMNIQRLAVHCYVDNKSLVDSLYSSHQVEEKRLRIDLAVIDDKLEKKEIEKVDWVDTTQQLANCMTKRGASSARLMEAISV